MHTPKRRSNKIKIALNAIKCHRAEKKEEKRSERHQGKSDNVNAFNWPDVISMWREKKKKKKSHLNECVQPCMDIRKIHPLFSFPLNAICMYEFVISSLTLELKLELDGMQNANNTLRSFSHRRWQHFILLPPLLRNSEMQFAYLQLFNPSISSLLCSCFFLLHMQRRTAK